MPPRQPFRQNAPNPAARPLAQAIEHHKAGRLAEAEQKYRVALTLAPRNSDVLRSLGALYIQTAKVEQALPLLQRALEAQPNHPETLFFLGNALLRQGKPEAALDHYRRALQVQPHFPEAHANMGVCWRDMNDLQQAVSCFEMALNQKPKYVDGMRNLAATLWSMGRNADARAVLERALQIAPDDAAVVSKLGSFLYGEGKVSEALEQHNKALILAPGWKDALFEKSLALLALGEYREGWKLYEAGLGNQDTRGPNPFAAAKIWDGKAAPDKHLLIWTEQGLGDSLQFIRYVEYCKERVGRISLLCQRPLARLYKNLPFIDSVFDTIGEVTHFDEHVALMSLPHLFDTVLETVPDVVPYLRVVPGIQAKWAAKFSDVMGFKIGLVWAGGSHKDILRGIVMDRKRSVGLLRMKPWLGLTGATFYSLQKDEAAEQIAALDVADRITDFMSEVTDMADTAAIIQNLDLVITVDTSVAHLAGALGKPVWILSRYDADWRWLQNRPTNPWYPTARIFGQPKLGDWDSVMAEVGCELAKEIAKKSASMTTQSALSPFRSH